MDALSTLTALDSFNDAADLACPLWSLWVTPAVLLVQDIAQRVI